MKFQRKRALAERIITAFKDVPCNLTPRKTTIAGLMLLGLNAVQISEELGISRHTVRVHLIAIYRHFDVAGQPEFMALLLLPRVFGET